MPYPTFVTCFLHKALWGVWCQPPTMSVPCLTAETASGLCWSSHAPHSTASPNSFPPHGLASHKVKYCRS